MGKRLRGKVVVVEEELSEKVKVRYGYRDAHVEIWVKLPWPIPDKTIRIRAKNIPKIAELLERAVALRESKSEEVVYERKIEDGLWLRIGFDDGRAEVRFEIPIFRDPVLRIEPYEVPIAKRIIDAALAWLKGGKKGGPAKNR